MNVCISCHPLLSVDSEPFKNTCVGQLFVVSGFTGTPAATVFRPEKPLNITAPFNSTRKRHVATGTFMNLHEYQAKALFKAYGMPVPNYIVAASVEETRLAAEKLGTEKVVVKAQVHAGGRRKAGGVKLVDTPREAEDYAKSMLGTRLVTMQTDAAGQPVNTVLVEEICEIENELYLGVVLDQTSQRIVVMASTEGGVEIEQIIVDTPEEILKIELDPLVGVMPEQYRELAVGLGLSDTQTTQFTQLLSGLCKLFVDKELALVEINPLVITKSGDLVCLDAKINIDSDVLCRHSDLEALRDKSQE